MRRAEPEAAPAMHLASWRIETVARDRRDFGAATGLHVLVASLPTYGLSWSSWRPRWRRERWRHLRPQRHCSVRACPPPTPPPSAGQEVQRKDQEQIATGCHCPVMVMLVPGTAALVAAVVPLVSRPEAQDHASSRAHPCQVPWPHASVSPPDHAGSLGRRCQHFPDGAGSARAHRAHHAAAASFSPVPARASRRYTKPSRQKWPQRRLPRAGIYRLFFSHKVHMSVAAGASAGGRASVCGRRGIRTPFRA
jgi:hypothetical protein